MKIDYYLVMVLITIVLSGAIITLVIDNNRLTKDKKILCIITPVLVIPAALAEYFVVELNGAAECFRAVHVLLKVFELSVAPIMVYCLITAFNGKENGKKIIPIAIFNVVIQIISGCTGLLYYFDAQNVYHHGTLYWVYTVIYILCGIIFFSECIRFSKHYQNRNVASLCAILFFLLFGLSFHNLFNYIRADWLTIAIAYSLFFNYYNTLVEQTDSLTHLLDRKSYDISVENIHKKVDIIIFDVDDFKSVNDTYGHDAGDVCLQTVAKAIRNTFIKYGYCYRIGGDEFCVIIRKNINISEVNHSFCQELDRLRESGEIHLPNVSWGSATFDPQKEEIHQAIKRADGEMYEEKKNKKLNNK